MNDEWKNFFHLTLGTPIRAAFSLIFVIVLILTGVVGILVSAFINNILGPLAILAVLVALVVFIAKGGKR